MQMDQNETRLEEIEGFDVNNTRPVTRLHQRDDLWNDESSSHPGKTSSRCDNQLPLPHKSVNRKTLIIRANPTDRSKSFGSKERNVEDLFVQDIRYSALNNHVHKKPSSASHLDMLSPSTDIGSTRPLAGLIVMCNDKVRRSFFKYGVLGVPLRKKPNLDRVDASTLIFLFEFESRALWGIYQATSEVSIDIEKDAYRGSETAFPAQVKFHILRKCRPLPEKLFKLAIAENYYTPTKFQFELTDEQVTFLTRLYYVHDAEKLRLNRALSTEEATTLYETADKERFLEGSVYQLDGVRSPQRNGTTIRPSHCKQLLLVRGGDNPEAHTSVPDENLPDGAVYDHPRYIFWHPKGISNLKTHKDRSLVLRNQALEYSIDDEQSHGGCGSARVNTALLEPRTSSLYCYPHMEGDILSEENLQHQLCQPKLFHYAGNPIYKPCDPSKNFSDAALESSARTKQSFDEENYLRMLELRQLNSSMHSRLPSLRNPQPDISASQRLHRGNSSHSVALWNLDLHTKKRLNPMHPPENHRTELTPDLQAWEMPETSKDEHNILTIEALTKSRLMSSKDAHANTHHYSVDGFPTRGKSSTQSHDDTVHGDSTRGKASTCVRRQAPPEEVWQDNLCRKRLTMLRSKSVQDVVAENPVCTAKCCMSKQETVQLDDGQWLESILCNVKDGMHRNHEVGSSGAWLGDNGHVSGDTTTIMSKSCNGVLNLLKNEEQDIQEQADQNGVSDLHFQQQKSSPCTSVTYNEVDCVKPPRKSVWSRLSASRNWLDSRQISIPNEETQSELKNLLFSEVLPRKRNVEDVPEYEIDERSSHTEDCSAFVEDGFNVQFKRRKLGISRKAVPSTTSQEQGGTVGVDHSSIPIDRRHDNNPRERRKIRRPL